MAAYPIQQIWKESFQDFLNTGIPLSKEQLKASFAILNCKTGALGYSVSQCQNCGYQVTYPHSCRNRNCPNCQAVKKEASCMIVETHPRCEVPASSAYRF